MNPPAAPEALTLEKLDRKDLRLIGACALIGAASLFIGVRYYFRAFPEASIEFRETRQSSTVSARAFVDEMGASTDGYTHAAIFGFDDDAKTFLEREVGVEESNHLLETTVRLWRWQHRWFRPLQKEEFQVSITTRGEPVGFQHALPEEAEGASLPPERARELAEEFLEETMKRPLDTLAFVEGSLEKLPHRTDHTFTWKLDGFDVKGADYLFEVNVAGGEIAGYQEYLEVPDTWTRDYQTLRSRNLIASQIDAVFLLLTAVAMLVLLVRHIRGGNVRWRAAGALGIITFVLLFLSQLNRFPSELYSYDTTTSFGGFLARMLLGALATSLTGGAAIFLIAAAAEPLYRKRWPERLSLTSILRFRALRTREFFIASLVGLTLTAFFFAYENVFYLIANHFGAWSPRDVPYDDLLSTAVPWAFVLFFGWFPAISEEFISRMFSIPFFEAVFRSRILAVLLASFIWGFGHAAYPNQPFWIRGLEVGLAGILFSLVLYRFGIIAVVICHFSVDALYTAFVLIRSDNPYYNITGSLSAGIFAVVFLGALAAYFLKGGFVPAEVTNAEETIAPPPEPLISHEPAEAAEAAPYRPFGSRALAVCLGVAALLGLISLAPVRSFGDRPVFATVRGQAKESAASFLRGAGFDVSRYRSAVVTMDRVASDPLPATYLQEVGGLDLANRVYREQAPTPIWRVRFFVPLQHEEFRVSVEPATGQVVGFERDLPEDAPGATLEKDEALRLAGEFLKSHGRDPRTAELKDQTQEDNKNRRDHTLAWEVPIEGGGEARLRYEVVIQGDRVGSWTRGVKVPEEWRRRREETGVLTTILQYMKIPYLGVLSGMAVLLLIARIRRGEIPWRFALLAGIAAVVPTLMRLIVGLDSLWSMYDTSMPAAGFAITLLVGVFIGCLLVGLGAAVLAALAGALFPSATIMLTREGRARYGRDALIAGLVTFSAVRAIPVVFEWIRTLVPAGRMIREVPVPDSVASVSPLLAVLGQALSGALLTSALGGIVAGVLLFYARTSLARVLVAVFFVISFIPGEARRPEELFVEGLARAITFAAALLLGRYVLRNNPLAWLWSAWFTLGIVPAIELLQQPARFFQWQGALLLLCVLLTGILLLRRPLGPEPAQTRPRAIVPGQGDAGALGGTGG